MAEWMQEYLDTAAGQIRWKRARPVLMAELHAHLEDQYDACLTDGLPEVAARTESLRQMGDAVKVGQELDRVHRPKAQWGLLCLTAALAVTGALLRGMIAGDSSVGAPERVIFYLVLGLAALFGCYFLDYSFLGRHAGLCYWGAVVLGVLALILSPSYAGTSYYTRYFVVMLYPMVYGGAVYQMGGRGWRGFVLSILALLPLAVICLAAPSILGLLLLLLSGLVMLGLAIQRNWFQVSRGKAAAVLTGLAVLAILLLLAGAGETVFRRLQLALDPALEPEGRGYLALRISETLSGASVWGPSPAAETALPNWDTDQLLTSMICRVGWIPFGLLCAVLLVLLVRGAVKVLGQRSVLGQFIGIGILLTLGVQTVLSVVMNLGFVFLSAACPFITGNLHSVMDLAMMGVLLSVFRQADLPFEPVGGVRGQRAGARRLVYRDGCLMIRLRPVK